MTRFSNHNNQLTKITSSYFPTLVKMVIFGLFLLKKMILVAHSIYKRSICKYFSKSLLRNLNHFQGFSQSYQRPGPFRAIPSICLKGPCLIVWSCLAQHRRHRKIMEEYARNTFSKKKSSLILILSTFFEGGTKLKTFSKI